MLLSPPKEMLQEKSLPETEEGFPTAPAPGHADSSAGSPVLGVAGGSSTPLSSPQLPDPEQVRTARPRLLPGAFDPHPPRQPGRSTGGEAGARPPSTAHLLRPRYKKITLFFTLLLFFPPPCKAGRPAPAVGSRR